MKITLKTYRKYKDQILKHYEEGQLTGVCYFCTLCHVPVVVAYTFINEEHNNMTEDINRLIKFYNITSINEE